MKLCSLLLLLLLFTLFFTVPHSSSNPDFEALLAFKASSDISNSLSSWSNSSDPCSGSWLGVSCNNHNHHHHRVTRLILQNLNLTGPIQTLTRLTHLRLLSLKHNNLSSSSLDFSSWKNIKLLFLSHNQFSGNFPSGISQLHRLRRLDISHNRFSGRIPVAQLTELPNLLTLRLESNSFTGTLQSSPDFTSRTLLDFNLSNNNLSGEIPKSFSSFPLSCFTGNENLCGNPLPNKCFNWTFRNDPIPIRVPHESGGNKISRRTILAISVTDVSVVIAIAIGIFFFCRKRRLGNQNHQREKKKMKKDGELKKRDGQEEEIVFFEGSKGFRVDDLLKGSAEMLGKGNVGTTYKVVMDGGDVVVVKRVRQRRKKKEFDWLLREIGGLRHRNIVSLRAYYSSTDELLLVSDFLPNGSLHSLLHGNRGPGRTPLDWTTRLKLVSGLAEGLSFLHSVSKSKFSHGHLTSCNVVVDQEGNACISDIALHQCFLTSTPSNNSYKAPELVSNASRKFSHKSDVYSLGVILLEILTGKMATGEGETSLVKWVQCVVKEEWTSEVFDFELLRYKQMEEEMVALLQVALLCLTPIPRDRPKMSDARKMIEDIRSKGCTGGGTHSPSLNDHSSDFSPTQSEHTPNFNSS